MGKIITFSSVLSGNKGWLRSAMLLLAFLPFFAGSASAQYCTPNLSSCSGNDYIQSFSTSGGISNITNNNTGCSPSGGAFYNSLTHSSIQGTSFNFSITNNPHYSGSFRVWVDWDQNGVFGNTASELIFATTAAVSVNTVMTGSATVPLTAIPGTTRMRVIERWAATTFDGCGVDPNGGSSGEWEDYNFTVVATTPCSGTPNAGTVVSNPAQPCPGATANLSLSGSSLTAGLTYQWQEFDPITSTWVNATAGTGGTTANYTTQAITTSRQFRMVITCTNSGQSSTSAPITVAPNVFTFPYTENFEGITANNQLPTCMSASSIGQYNGVSTWITSPGSSTGMLNHTPGGSKYATFYYYNSHYLFTPGLPVQAGKTYRVSFWYVSSNTSTWNSIEVAAGLTPDAASMTLAVGSEPSPNTSTYKQAVMTFVATATGNYHFGFNPVTNSGNYNFLSIDDIEIVELPPCTGTPVAGTITSPAIALCPGSTIDMNLTGNVLASGLTYQWYDSVAGAPGWTPITGAVTDRLPGVTVTNNITSYKVVVTCTNAGGGIDSTPVYTLTPLSITLPYSEPFESITAAGQLPNCMQATNFGATGQTYTDINSTGNHTPGGTDYGVFRAYNSAWFFTPGMPLEVGKTYKFSYWYKTSGPTGTNIRSSLQATVGTGPNQARVISILNTIPSPTNTGWVKDSVLFAPATTRMYVFGLNAGATNGFSNSPLYIDDLRVDELPPCTGAPLATVTPPDSIVLCPTAAFTLSGPITPNSGLAYQWYSSVDSINWDTVANGRRYIYTAGAPAVTRWYRLVVKCTLTGDSTTSNVVKVRVDNPLYAPIPYVNDFETWVSYCANSDVPNKGNWLQAVPTGNSSWRRNDQGSTANWTNVGNGAYSPAAKSGSYSARFHSATAPAVAIPNVAGEGRLRMYLNCSGTSGNNALYFYNINRPGTAGEDSLGVWLSTNGGLSFSQIAAYDTANNWKLRIIPFNSTSAATIISFQARKVTSTTNATDIGIDSVFVAPPCTSTPSAGLISLVGNSNVCAGDSVTFNLAGTSMAGNLEIAWERSTTSATAGFGAPFFTTTLADGYSRRVPVFQTGWYRVKVTCLTTGQSSYSNVLQVTTVPVPFAGLPFTEDFEQWQNRCSTSDIPSASWANNPATGNRSWRRNDQGSTASWTNLLSGQWWPAVPAAAIGSYSARFHNAQASPSGSRGSLSLYVNCSAPGDKELRYFVNMNDRPAANTDSLVVSVSTDGGATFSRLERVQATNGWEQRIVPFVSTSAQTILRFMTYSQAGNDDIGLDYVQVLEACNGTPVAGTVNGPTDVCPGTNFRLGTTGTTQSGGMTFQWQVSTTGANAGFNNIAGATQPFLNAAQTQPSWYRLIVRCGTDSSITPSYALGISSFFYCYCPSGAQTPSSGALFRENIGNVNIRTQPNNAVLFTNGIGAPLNNNSTATNRYSNFQNLTPIPLHRDSTYRLTVQQVSYTTNSPSTVSAYIDYNFDGIFDPVAERVLIGNTQGGTLPAYSFGNIFTVPAYVTPGITGMRVVLQQPTTTTPDPCGTYGNYGETEDYLVELRYPGCASLASVDAGTAIASDTALCIGNPITLIDTSYRKDLYGTSRQWEMSLDNGVTWQAVGPPNTDTLQPVLTNTTLYRYTIICNNGVRSYSNVVRVGLYPSTQCYCPSYASGGPSGTLDSSDVGSFSIGNYVFQLGGGGPHLLNPQAVRRFTNHAPQQVANNNIIELNADSTYLVDVYHIMRGGSHKNAKVTLFMDFNNDLQFSAVPVPGYPSERVLTAYTSANNYYLDNMPVHIPAQQVIANTPTLMRLIINEDTNPNFPSDEGCGIYESGETEDFQVIFRCRTCPVGVSTVSGAVSEMNLYPNPTTGMATLEFSAATYVKDVELTITNMTGQVIKRQLFVQPGSNMKATIDLQDQPRGVYFVELKADNEKIVRKLIVR